MPDTPEPPLKSVIVAISALGTAVSLLSSLGVYYRLQYDVASNKDAIVELRGMSSRHANEAQETALHFQKLDLTYEAIRQRLESIDAKVTRPTARNERP